MDDSRERLYLVSCAAMFVFGIVLALPGTLLGLPEVVERLDLTLASRGALISTFFFGLLVGSLASGPVVDAVGHRRSLAGSALLIAACLPLIAVAPSPALAGAALAAIGVASAGANTASNALSSELFPHERGRRMNGIAIAVGAGGLALPAATALTSSFLPWTTVVWGCAVFAAVVAMRAAVIDIPRGAARAVPTAGAIASVTRQPGLVWLAALVMLAAGTEASMAGFTSTYLTALGFAPAAATWILSSHWVGLIVGRLLFARRVDRAKGRAIARAAVAGAAAVLVFALASSTMLLAAAPFAIGVAIAIVMPTGLALGGERYPQNAGSLFGLLLTLAQAGAMALPAIIGVVSQRGGVRAGMLVLVLNNAVIAALALRAARQKS